ncbi:GGDEF domain-containing protein [Paraburkholderia adhaesiva]|uniref:GGDEF domain-containing protein n=1 Tax=Paraburkholderia adhaesiva TaxID=2883244 RepID=UPI001F1A9907|nr:sensor domain-containing diguanylate cyclase [Paraburkholderia adhaesiva]
MVIALPFVVMVAGRDETIDHARETSRNMSSLIALDLERNFEFYDVQLLDLIRSIEQLKAGPLSTALQDNGLFRSLPDSAFVDRKLIIDASGRIVASADGLNRDPALALRDRDYFIEQQRNPAMGLAISHPLRSRFPDGKLSIALTRRISGPDGSFAGIALFTVQLESFQRLLDTIDVEKPGLVEILSADGTVLGAKPGSDRPVGTSVAQRPTFAEMRQRDSGSTIATGSDGIQRIYTYQRVKGLPFIAVVAPATDDVMRAWRRQFFITAAASVLWGLVLTVGAWLLAFTLRDKLRAQAELAQLAATDPLTKLKNRRTLDDRLQAEWIRAVRDGHSELSMLFIDIDRFKLFNDTYGHAAGDDILATVAGCIASSARRSIDLVARYGGEEFVVVLPDTGHEAALEIAETIRRNVESLRIANPGSETGQVTVSIGCTTYHPADGGGPEQLVSITDEQLYEAKSSGRNQVKAIVVTSMLDKQT